MCVCVYVRTQCVNRVGHYKGCSFNTCTIDGRVSLYYLGMHKVNILGTEVLKADIHVHNYVQHCLRDQKLLSYWVSYVYLC